MTPPHYKAPPDKIRRGLCCSFPFTQKPPGGPPVRKWEKNGLSHPQPLYGTDSHQPRFAHQAGASKISGQDQALSHRLIPSLRSHGPSCPAPVRTLVEHKRNHVEIDPPLSTQLEGQFLSSKTILSRRADVLTRPACFSPENHPPRRRGYQRTWYGIPPTQRQWRKRDHRSLKRRPPKTEG